MVAEKPAYQVNDQFRTRPKFATAVIQLSKPPIFLDVDDHRHEMWYELFYDLILVTGVYNLGHLMAADFDNPRDIQKAVVISVYFYAVVSTWVSFQRYVNRFNTLDLVHVVYYVCHLLASLFLVTYLQGPQHEHVDCLESCNVTSPDVPVHHRRLFSTFGSQHRHLLSSTDDEYHSYDLLQDQTGAVSGYAVMQILLGLMYLRVAYYIPEYRNYSAGIGIGAILDGLIWTASLPLNHTKAAIGMYGAGFAVNYIVTCITLCKFSYPPYQVHHFSTRCSLLFMIFCGEFVLQLGIQQHTHTSDSWYKTCFSECFGIVACMAIQYSYSQPTNKHQHVLKQSDSSKALLWIGGHYFLAVGILVVAVGVSKVFQSLDDFDPDSNSGRRALSYICFGCFVVQMTITFQRMIIKGCRMTRHRVLFFAYRIAMALGYIVVYGIYTSSGISHSYRSSPVGLFALVFVLAFLSSVLDLLKRQDHNSPNHGINSGSIDNGSGSIDNDSGSSHHDSTQPDHKRVSHLCAHHEVHL